MSNTGINTKTELVKEKTGVWHYSSILLKNGGIKNTGRNQYILMIWLNEKKISGFDEDFYDKKLIPFAKTVSTDLNKVIDSAGWYATKFKSSLLTKMDKGLTDTDITSVTKVINGGTNGLSERKNYTKWIKEFWKYADFHK